MSGTGRRWLLRASAAAAAVASLAALGLPRRQRAWEAAGTVPRDTGWTPVLDGAVWLRRDEGGSLAALERICPHQGCVLSMRTEDVYCPCHGSRFDRRGRRLEGPSRRGLAWFPVRVKNGVVEVDRTRPRTEAQWIATR